MKRLFNVGLLFLAASSCLIYSCRKESDQEAIELEKLQAQQCLQESKGVASTLSTSPYNVYLYSITSNSNGTYTWEWRIRNLTPGNGKPGSGTAQDLSHWGITLGDCVKPENIVSAATSTNGTNWSSFNPEYKIDPSQSCYTNSVVKFNQGTSGTDISYYRITINKNVTHASRNFVYKSGNNTGCGVAETCGFGCEN